MTSADEELTGVGDELRQTRIRRGRSIAQAHQATRIARHYLEAMEDEDWQRMPAATFTRGFLSSYAQYLGLDPAAVLERCPFPASLPGEGLDFQPAATQSQQNLEPSHLQRDDLQPPRVHLGAWIAAAIVILVIIAGVVAVVSLREEIEPVEPEGPVPGISQVPEAVSAASSAAPSVASNTSFEPLPDLTAFNAGQAINYIKLLNAPYVIVSVYDDLPVGSVLDQSPSVGADPHADDVITLVVSRGPRPTSSTGG